MNVAPALARIAVGIVVARRKADSPWIDFTWKPVAALAGLPDAAPWTVLSQDPDGVTFYAGAAEIELYRTETTNYRDNLGSSAPMLWVALRQTGVEPPYEVFAVTLSTSCRCRRRYAQPSTPSWLNIMSSGCSTNANATARIRKRSRGADRCSKNEMSEPENFIARWSRRKRETAEEEAEATKPGRGGPCSAGAKRRERARIRIRLDQAAAGRNDYRRERHPGVPPGWGAA